MRRLSAALLALATLVPAAVGQTYQNTVQQLAQPPGSSICSNTAIPAGNTVAAPTAGANNEVAFATGCLVPAMATPGALKCEAWGLLSVGATVPNLRGRVFINGTAVLDTTSVPGLVASTNYGWHALFSVNVMSIGASGSLDAQGELRAQIAATGDLVIPVRNASPFTVATTGPLSITLAATWGNAMAGSAITLTQIWCK